MIETRLLQQFVAVAEELHFNRAAERLHMAQPPLSQAIRKLESAVGAPLFVRTNRSVALTPAGVAFLVTARSTLRALEEGVAQTRRVAVGIEGHLTLTFINIAPYAALLRALRGFRHASPGISFTMVEATTQEQVIALEEGRADIGFMRTPGTSVPHLRLATVSSEPIVVALPAGHRLEAAPTIALELLKHDAFVASPRTLGKGFHDQLLSLCHAAGFVPDIVQHGRQMQTLIALVAAGFGVALLPASLATNARTDVAFRPLQVDASDALSRLDLFMAWNETRASAIRDRLIQAVLETLPSP
ncbi:LysR substrate-binding domain-containing protein [Stenotrophomonas rhizophila]|uniref:LysR substrate-binding domain-containing protein n=1 Tax=Stenotrophomonas rhizophila TaxID=216778 RepID=UPI002A6A3904|nr:LysR substrate-binding domain-containing protein [Stenotrophomonas rhizophila]MDY0956356.1 LysR substrate-binding domain-containing protein [Stenotrophomonas rhizophila]